MHHLRMTFGFSTSIDLLSWIAGVALGLKVLATVILVSLNKAVRDQPGWGASLWWASKITPVIFVTCLTMIALLEGEARLAWFGLAMGLFVIVAVPLKVRQRRNRIALNPPTAWTVRLQAP